MPKNHQQQEFESPGEPSNGDLETRQGEVVAQESQANFQQQLDALGIPLSGQISEPSIVKKINEVYLGKVFDITAKDRELELEKARLNEFTKRWAIAAVLFLVAMILIYSGITHDKDLSKKIIDIAMGTFGGFGVYSVVQNKDDK